MTMQYCQLQVYKCQFSVLVVCTVFVYCVYCINYMVVRIVLYKYFIAGNFSGTSDFVVATCICVLYGRGSIIRS